jgi:pSer/pThr/pTyr-binding forkhead associated (FHA) protein
VTTELREAPDPVARHSLSPSELKQLLAAEREGEPFLAFRDGAGALRLHVLGRAVDTHTVGRRHGMSVPITWDGEVSGLHAQLECPGGEWTIIDDGLSTNGTYVNGGRVHGRKRLRDGDRIRVGRTIIAFNAGSPQQLGSTVAALDVVPLPRLTDAQRRVLVALCRPSRTGRRFATPASNQQIATELFLSVDAVKAHLRTLFAYFELTDLPQNEKRARLADRALELGLISQRDFE